MMRGASLVTFRFDDRFLETSAARKSFWWGETTMAVVTHRDVEGSAKTYSHNETPLYGDVL